MVLTPLLLRGVIINVTERLDEIGARAAAATEGPWRVETDNADSYEGGITDGDYPYAIHGPDTTRVWANTPSMVEEHGHQFSEVCELTITDATFIAAARADVPWLVEQVRKRDAALRAVLALHAPVISTGSAWCSLCADSVSEYETFVPYPCPTVRAITEALETRP